jgi:hypothetical protein
MRVSWSSVKEAVANWIERDATTKKSKTKYNKDITTRQSNKGNWPQSEIAYSMQASQSSMEEAVNNWNGHDSAARKQK